MSTLIPYEDKYRDQFLHLFINDYVNQEWRFQFNDKVLNTICDRILDPTEPVYSVLAIDTNSHKVVGFANYITHRFTWTIEDALYLNDLFVSEDCRGKGIGTSLLKYIYEESDRLNCKKCYWNTEFDNHRAQLLYSKIAVKTGSLSYRKP